MIYGSSVLTAKGRGYGKSQSRPFSFIIMTRLKDRQNDANGSSIDISSSESCFFFGGVRSGTKHQLKAKNRWNKNELKNIISKISLKAH